MTKVETKNTTLMFIDIVDYTAISNELDAQAFNSLHDAFDSIVKQSCDSFDGTAIKKIGDCYMLSYDEPTNALFSAMLMQELFKKYNMQTHEQRMMKVRVGVHEGIVLVRDKDLYGTTVNTASRIESIANPGEILFSQEVKKHINEMDIPHIQLGPRRLKGLDVPVTIYKVLQEEDQTTQKTLSDEF